MILPDVNVLIYAFRPGVPRHALCRAWLESVVAGDARFGVSPLVLAAVVRVTTNPRIYDVPSAIDDAFAFCDNLLGQPHCEIVEPGERHRDIFGRLCIAADIHGRRVTDAWFAALAIEWGCEWITMDRGGACPPAARSLSSGRALRGPVGADRWARFHGLKWSVPAAPAR